MLYSCQTLEYMSCAHITCHSLVNHPPFQRTKGVTLMDLGKIRIVLCPPLKLIEMGR